MTETVKVTTAEEQTPMTSETTEIVSNVEENQNVHEMSKEELVGALRKIVENKDVNSHKEVTAIKQALFAVRQRELAEQLNAFVEEGNDPTAFVSAPDPLDEEGKQLQAQFRELRAAYLEAEEVRKNANLERKQSLVNEILALADDIDNINLNYPKFQELQQAFKETGDVPAQNETEIWKSYQNAVERFYDCLNVNKELRALDFKKNLEAKRNLIELSLIHI